MSKTIMGGIIAMLLRDDARSASYAALSREHLPVTSSKHKPGKREWQQQRSAEIQAWRAANTDAATTTK